MKSLTSPILLVGVPNQVLDIRYITGFSAWDPVIYLQDRRRKHLVVPGLELERAKRSVNNIMVRSMQDLPVSRGTKSAIEARVLSLLREERIKTVIVNREFPIGMARNLERSGIRVEVVERTMFPEREVKTGEEVRNIRESQIAAVKAMRAAVYMIARTRVDKQGYLRQGSRKLTAEIIRTAINQELLKHNCISEGTIVACGRQAADPHCQGSGPLRGNEGIVIDIFPRNLMHGYWGDLSRTVVKGKAPALIKKMYTAVKSAQNAALSITKPGIMASRIHQIVAKSLCERGFRNDMVDGRMQGFIHGTGHGVGLAIHESPGIGHGGGRLKIGNVITIEPGLYYHDTGGVRIEDMIEVTKNGWRYLGICGKTLEI